MEPAIRAARPHVFPRDTGSIVPRPPPPDWTLESGPPPARRRPASVEPWPTSLLTLPSPVYQPLDVPASRERPPRRVALGLGSLVLVLASLALAFWQLYWLLESSESGRALLDRAAALVAAVAHRF